MNYRNRALLELAQDAPCFVRLWKCDGRANVVAAHSNRQRHGKGRGIKAHDCFIAFACHSCHYKIDQGNELTREQRADAWERGFEGTLLHLWRSGLIQVTPKHTRAARLAMGQAG